MRIPASTTQSISAGSYATRPSRSVVHSSASTSLGLPLSMCCRPPTVKTRVSAPLAVRSASTMSRFEWGWIRSTCPPGGPRLG